MECRMYGTVGAEWSVGVFGLDSAPPVCCATIQMQGSSGCLSMPWAGLLPR